MNESEVEIPKGFGVRHKQVLLMFLAGLVEGVLRMSLPVGIVGMSDSSLNPEFPSLEYTSSQINVLQCMISYGYTVSPIIAGYWAGKYGPKENLTYVAFITGTVVLLIPPASDFGGFYVTCLFRALQGLGQGFFFPSVMTHMSKWVVPEERSRFFALAMSGVNLGSWAVFCFGGYLGRGPGGWPSVFYVSVSCETLVGIVVRSDLSLLTRFEMVETAFRSTPSSVYNVFYETRHKTGIFGIVYSIICLLFVVDSPDDHTSICVLERNFIESQLVDSSINSKKMSVPWKSIFTSLPVLAILLAQSAENWGFWVFFTLIPRYLEQINQIDIKQDYSLMSLPYLLMTISTIAFGLIDDALRNRKLISYKYSQMMWSDLALYGGASLFFVLAVCEVTFTTVVIVLSIAVSLKSACNNGWFSNGLIIAPNFSGIIMGLMLGPTNVISLFAPTISAWILKDETNLKNWRILFGVTSIVYFFGGTAYNLLNSSKTQTWNNPVTQNLEIPIIVVTAVPESENSAVHN